jgi:ABC-type enterochelin transport system permease subunit
VNVVLKNFIISIATVIIGGLVLWSAEYDSGGGVNIPWLLLIGFGAGCLVISLMTWWKRRSLPPESAAKPGKKGRGK